MTEGAPELSPREMEIVKLVSKGITNQMIARELSISENTVKVHLRNVFAKLNVESRTEATLFAISHGWVEVEGSNIPLSLEAADGASHPSFVGRRWIWTLYLALVVALAAFLVIFVVPRITAWQAPAQRGGEGSSEGAAKGTRSTLLLPPVQASPTVAAGLAAKRWKSLAVMPSGRWGFATAAFRDKIYVFGGKDSDGVSSSVLAYDPGEDRWSSFTPKPISAYDVGAAVVGGKIYVPGGWMATGEFTSTLEVYDPVADVWTRGAPMPSPLAAYGLVSLEGRLFVIGGWDGRRYRSSLYEYDPSRDRWQVRADMPTPRAHVSAEAVDGRIYVIGGANSGGDLDICEIYDPTQVVKGGSPWSTGAPLPEPRSRAASAVLGRNIYIAGGRGRRASSTYLRYDVGGSRWLSFEIPFAGEWFDLGLEALDIRLYALGGWPEENSRALWEYQALYRVFIP